MRESLILVLLPLLTWSCSTHFGKGAACVLPFTLRGQIYFSCTTLGPGAPGEGMTARCPTSIPGGGLEAPEDPEYWGDCWTDCPLRTYRNNTELLQAAATLAAQAPRLASVYTIGESVLGEPLQVLRVTAGADRERVAGRPRVRLVANMHGNEVTGREVLAHLGELLARGYGRQERITRILDTIEVHILATMNPDGWRRAEEGSCGGMDFASGRLNERRVDLNRDFPGAGEGLEGLEGRQPETAAVAKWMLDGPWVVGANFHDGAVVASYPWDHYTDPEQRTGEHHTADQAVFRALAGAYADNHPGMRNSSACLKYSWLGPTTNGAAWYPKNGTMKDFGYRETGCLDMVMELACCKFLPQYFLPREWDNNRESLLTLLEWAGRGLRGLVTDLAGAPVAGAQVTFSTGERSGGAASSPVVSSSRGEYWRLLLPGVYRVEATSGPCSSSGPTRVEVGEGLAVTNLVLRRKFNCNVV